MSSINILVEVNTWLRTVRWRSANERNFCVSGGRSDEGALDMDKVSWFRLSSWLLWTAMEGDPGPPISCCKCDNWDSRVSWRRLLFSRSSLLVCAACTRKKASTAGCRTKTAWWSGVSASSFETNNTRIKKCTTFVFFLNATWRHSLKVFHRLSSKSCWLRRGNSISLLLPTSSTYL